MMRNSTGLCLMLGVAGAFGLLTGCSVTTTDNSITFKTKPEFVDSSHAAISSTGTWDGEEITINNDGVNPLVGTGGIDIVVDPSATAITAKASFAARADVEADAQDSIRDVITGFKIDQSNGKVAVKCGHGQTHASSSSGESGCKLLTVTIPAGTSEKPIKLTVGSGMGGIRFKGVVLASFLRIDENGLGDVDVKVTPVAGAQITVTGEDAVTVSVPSDFASSSVTLTVNEDEPQAAAERIITTAFPGLPTTGGRYPLEGALPANAAASLNVQSKGLLSDDTVTIKSL